MSRFFMEGFRAGCLGLTALVLLFLATANAMAETNDQVASDTRASTSMHYKSGGRDAARTGADGTESTDVYAPLETDGPRSKTAQPTKSALSKESSTQSDTPVNDFWIYDADVILFADDDDDGYFYGIDLLFDADTIYSSADVYAVVYLSLEGGPWNEYAVTEDFTIFGASSTDEFVLVTELASGYPTGSYDLLIELFDSFDGSYLASFGPEDSSELAFLPLEDFNRDEPGFDRPVTVSSGGGGGSAGMWLLVLLAILIARRRDSASPL